MKNFLMMILLFILLTGCATAIEVNRNPETGEVMIKYYSPKDYGKISGSVEVYPDGKLKALKFEALEVNNEAAKTNAEVFKGLIGSAERAWTRTPAP